MSQQEPKAVGRVLALLALGIAVVYTLAVVGAMVVGAEQGRAIVASLTLPMVLIVLGLVVAVFVCTTRVR